MRAGELCVRDVVTADQDETATDAARRMAALDVGDVIVVERRRQLLPRPIGVVTDRDLVLQVLARPERIPYTTKLSQVMRRDLVIANEDDEIESVVERMRQHAVRRIPIVDATGGLVGMISIDDVIGWMRDQIETATKLLERQGHGPQLRASAAR